MRMRRGIRYVFVAILCSLCAAPGAHAAARKTVKGELSKLYAAGKVAPADYQADLQSYADARAKVKQLRGAGGLELDAVVRDLEDMAARAQLAPSRLPALFLTLQRNTDYWTTR